jgi:Holliday junction resolvase
MKKFGRTDDNQKEIVKTLKKAGCNILSLAAMGGGVPDLLVQRAGVLYLLEVKDGSKSPSRRKLTPHQIKFREDWIYFVVNDIDEALKAVGI